MLEVLRKLVRGENLYAVLLSSSFLLLYVLFQTTSIFGGDAGDLVSAAFVHGVAHPPGYPLYTFIGWLLTLLPFSTVAWRVGLLSSIPGAATIGILFLVLKKYNVKTLPAIVAVTTLGVSYLFWLYSSVAEVFSLHVFFVVLLLFFLQLFVETRKNKYIYLSALIFGLSLTHHHTILFIVPGYLFMVYPHVFEIKNKLTVFGRSFLLFFLGLTPYIYVFLAASTNPAVNWEAPTNLTGFIRLVSRAVYGTFSTGSFHPFNKLDRYFQLSNVVNTLLLDFTNAGLILIGIGFILQYRRDRQNFLRLLQFFMLSGPLFIFYAKFPVVLNFYLGVTERFLLVPYVFLTIWLGIGISGVSSFLDSRINRYTKKTFPFSAGVIFFILPALLLLVNMPRFWSLRSDRTAEKLGLDILNTVPDHSLILLFDDTSFFNTQYVYLTGGGKIHFRDIRLLQLGVLGFDFYHKVVASQYLDIDTSRWKDPSTVLKLFVEDQKDKRPIFSNTAFYIDAESIWLQEGLLKRLYTRSALQNISTTTYIARNDELHQKYQNPASGALDIYVHPLLADVTRVYANAYIMVADGLSKLKDPVSAERFYKESVRLQPEILESSLKLAASLLQQKKCEDAQNLALDLADRFLHDGRPLIFLSNVYKECYPQTDKAKLYEQKLQELKQKSQTDLFDF